MKRSSRPVRQLGGVPRLGEARDQRSDASQPERAREADEPEAYKEFDAVELYCSKCRASVPVYKRLLLVLPEGEEYEYLCQYCSTSLGTKLDKSES